MKGKDEQILTLSSRFVIRVTLKACQSYVIAISYNYNRDSSRCANDTNQVYTMRTPRNPDVPGMFKSDFEFDVDAGPCSG